jgi:3-hydroxyisobutyrate dehydrogenase-like beta-hydroxyacid dehydrogenase
LDGYAVMTVGFVGAGGIGEPMVHRLVAAGHAVRVFARRWEVRERLVAVGAVLVDAPAATATGAAVVVSCLYSDDQIDAVLPAVAAGLEAGAVLASHTTGTPAALDRLRPAAAARGAAVVDAPFSGTAEDARAGRLTVLVGGSATAVSACEPVLAAYTGRVVRTGGPGSALSTKLVNNVLFAGLAQITLDAMRLAGELGLDPVALAAALEHCSGGSGATRHLVASGSPERFADRVLPYLRKDLDACTGAGLPWRGGALAAAVEAGPLPLAETPR